MEARERLVGAVVDEVFDGGIEDPNVVYEIVGSILKALHLTDAAALALMDGKPAERFFLSTDNDSHWYLVPVVRKADWDAWRDIPEDDERAWDPPDFAKRLNGAPSLVTFENPEMDQ